MTSIRHLTKLVLQVDMMFGWGAEVKVFLSSDFNLMLFQWLKDEINSMSLLFFLTVTTLQFSSDSHFHPHVFTWANDQNKVTLFLGIWSPRHRLTSCSLDCIRFKFVLVSWALLPDKVHAAVFLALLRLVLILVPQDCELLSSLQWLNAVRTEKAGLSNV